jgi:hypothetical protein
MKHVGIHIADRGAALVHVEHDEDELLVTAIERLPFSLTAVADRVQELDREIAEVRFAIDAEGLGAALWAVLAPDDEVRWQASGGRGLAVLAPDDKPRWQLYSGRGLERQSLVDALLVAVHEGRFHFAPSLPQQEAMTKALQGYRRQVREDGVVGSELVVALLLALIPPPPPPPETLAAWGDPFGSRDEADGAVVGGLRLVRAPDGTLVGIVEPKAEEIQ